MKLDHNCIPPCPLQPSVHQSSAFTNDAAIRHIIRDQTVAREPHEALFNR
jgi:hypothetical protein